jgi:hypothetical protein
MDRLPGSILPPTVKFSFPTMKKVRLWALWLLGAIALKTLASIFSDSLVMPALHTVSRWVLDLASLGLTSYKSRVYKQIAADNQFAIAFNTYLIVWVIHSVMMMVLIFYAYFRNSSQSQQIDETLKRLSDEAPNSELKLPHEAMRQEFVGFSRSARRLRLVVYFASLIITVNVVSDLISLARLGYVNSADVHYRQVVKSCV